MTIRRLLVANRGEIAVRVIRTCERLGIETVLGASEADLDSVPARLADKVMRIGPAPAHESYLSVKAVVDAATEAGVDAVHPGYGFLSESPALARACEDRALVFVGPSPAVLAALGDKLEARAAAADAGVPVLPGGAVADLASAERLVGETGFPVLVKAVGGGGGRGIRLVESANELGPALEIGSAEAGGAFGDRRVYLETYVEHGRHVEVQILGDGTDVVHAGDRDCSVQRRYQKLLEEAPAADLDGRLRCEIHDAALRLGRHLGYRCLGTVEFLVDAERGTYFFLEVNARLQVEHPVTEAVTGLDLVAEQLRLAEGEPLRLGPGDIAVTGHAFECRINAEDPDDEFRPAPGTVESATLPAGTGIRVDTALEAGAVVEPYYDSLVAKVIASGADRAEALSRMRAALGRCRIEGVPTTLSLQRALVGSEELAAGALDTGFLARFLAGASPGRARRAGGSSG